MLLSCFLIFSSQGRDKKWTWHLQAISHKHTFVYFTVGGVKGLREIRWNIILGAAEPISSRSDLKLESYDKYSPKRPQEEGRKDLKQPSFLNVTSGNVLLTRPSAQFCELRFENSVLFFSFLFPELATGWAWGRKRATKKTPLNPVGS